jgi:hypothetical protein
MKINLKAQCPLEELELILYVIEIHCLRKVGWDEKGRPFSKGKRYFQPFISFGWMDGWIAGTKMLRKIKSLAFCLCKIISLQRKEKVASCVWLLCR